MRSDIAISVKNLTKTYRIFGHPGDRIKQAFSFGRVRFHREFTALKDISLEIKKGETVGIIGRNGSGKSTLLQLLCGILKPSSGFVKVNGRISALLELGAGFNPEFTGRENVYFQGAVMGVSKEEMDARFEEIAAFADIGEFIDQPVRMYSSGMFVRLAFATMMHVDADILVIDEALAVGDAAFQRKCFDKLGDYFNGNDRLLLFVSHNIRQVERLCDKVLWLDHGGMMQFGDSRIVCSQYQDLDYQITHGHQGTDRLVPDQADAGEIVVHGVSLGAVDRETSDHVLMTRQPARIVIEFSCHRDLSALDIIVGFQTTDFSFIAAANTGRLETPPDFLAGRHKVECHFQDLTLLPGVYHLRLAFVDKHRHTLWHGQRITSIRVAAADGTNLMRIPPGLVDMQFEWHIPVA